MNLRFDNISSGTTIVEIFDLMGRRHTHQRIQVLDGIGIVEQVSTDHLIPGLYVSRIKGDDFLVTQSFIKK